MLNSTCVTFSRTHGQERVLSIRKKPPVSRHFDSYWNWVRQDTLLTMYYDIIFGRLTTVNREITVRCIALLNWADPDILQFMQYNIRVNQCDASKGETYRLVAKSLVKSWLTIPEKWSVNLRCTEMVCYINILSNLSFYVHEPELVVHLRYLFRLRALEHTYYEAYKQHNRVQTRLQQHCVLPVG